MPSTDCIGAPCAVVTPPLGWLGVIFRVYLSMFGRKKEGKTMELLEKFEQLTEENKAMILVWLDEIIANQAENPEEPGSSGKAALPEP